MWRPLSTAQNAYFQIVPCSVDRRLAFEFERSVSCLLFSLSSVLRSPGLLYVVMYALQWIWLDVMAHCTVPGPACKTYKTTSVGN